MECQAAWQHTEREDSGAGWHFTHFLPAVGSTVASETPETFAQCPNNGHGRQPFLFRNPWPLLSITFNDRIVFLPAVQLVIVFRCRVSCLAASPLSEV